MLSIDAKVDSDSAVLWQLRQYGCPASGMSSTTLGTLVRINCGVFKMLPVGYQNGLSLMGVGKSPPVNAETFKSGGGNCGGTRMGGSGVELPRSRGHLIPFE